MNNREEFFIAPKSLGLSRITISLIASAAGVWIIFSPVETAAWAGITGIIGYAVGQALPLILIALIGVRLIRRLPDGNSLAYWAQRRYGSTMRFICVAISIFYMTIFLAAELTAIGKAGKLLTPFPDRLTIAIIALLTWSYTNRGGFRLVVMTDILQLLIFIPLLLIIFVYLVFLSPSSLEASSPLEVLAQQEPQLLSFTHAAGLEFALVLIIAILAAQIFNHSLWQRAYSARDEKTLRQGFIISGLCMIPLVLIFGYLGLLAQAANPRLASPEIGIFALLLDSNRWLVLALGILAVALVLSSADSILNALSSLITEELSYWNNKKFEISNPSPAALSQARWITSLFILAVALIASQGYSVLYLFLLADLLCAGSVVPIMSGLYNDRIRQSHVCISILAGLGCGVLFMLRPDLTSPMVHNPIGSSWLLSFGSALLVSSLMTLACYFFASSSKSVKTKIQKA